MVRDHRSKTGGALLAVKGSDHRRGPRRYERIASAYLTLAKGPCGRAIGLGASLGNRSELQTEQFAEGLNGLGGDLDVAKEGEVRDVVDAHFLEHGAIFLHLEQLLLATDAQPRGVEVERAGVVASGD